ncbi:antibiotic biosynthesis monooxygenase [Streptosporangium sp. NPDC048047]|uniref:putative quinol monooxygenase n=1 Tax=Streptosporangium sp. NPDC048047 TaxID=3155748 RepID=UPI00343BF4B5
MVTLGLLTLLEVKPGKEEAAESFLTEALQLVEKEPGTTDWFAMRLGSTLYAIFGAFPDEEARTAHMSGELIRALSEQAPDLFEKAPAINPFDVIAAKSPG